MAVIGLTVGIGADTRNFNKNISKMNGAIKTTNKEVFNLSRSLQFKWDSKKFVEAQNAAKKSLIQTEVKAKALRDRLKFLETTDAGKTSQEFAKVRAELAKADFEAQRFKSELEKIKNMRIEEMAKKFEKVGTSITKAGQAMLPLSAAAAAILATLTKVTATTINFGDEIGTTAQQLNISTDALQKWQYIAEQTDVSSQQMVTGVRRIQQALGNLAAGEVEATSDALRALGFTTEQASGGMSENFEDIINALANMKDTTMQAHYANELFGARVGANLIPLLNDGGEGLAMLSAEFETFAYLTEEQVENLDAFEDVMDKLKFSFRTISNQIGVALLPVFENLAEVISEKIIPQFQKVADVFSGLTDEQKKLTFGILLTVSALAPMLLILGKLTGALGGVVKGVIMLKGALTLLSKHPIILVIVTIIGLMALLHRRNEEFRKSIQNLFSQLNNLLMPILKIIGELFGEILTAIMPLVNVLLNVLAPVLTFYVKYLAGMIRLISKVLIPYFKLLGKVWGAVFGFLPKIIEGVVAAIEWMVTAVVNSVEWMINSVVKLMNGLIDKMNAVGALVGITVGRIKEVDFDFKTPDIGSMITNFTQADASEFDSAVVSENDSMVVPDIITTDYSNVINNAVTDNSQKHVTINNNITVQNYAENVDVDDMIEQINLKLAKEF